MDGETKGPCDYVMKIGKKIKSVDNPIVKFLPISGNPLPDLGDYADDLSTDQRYLYNATKAVTSGNCSADFVNLKPGPISHSRWVTTACRVL